jgi:putative flippase GtrA
MALQAPGMYARIRPMLPELMKFGFIGGIGTVIDLGGAGLLHGHFHMEALLAKAVSVTVATVFSYLGSRFWTFKHRENQAMHREAVLFFALNIVGLVIAEATIGVVIYLMGLHSSFAYNMASFAGTGLGTIFRFYAYRKWVFLPPQQPAAAEGALAAGGPAVPDYPPWELDPAFLGLEAAANVVPVAAPAYAAPSYGSPWEPASVPPAPVHTAPVHTTPVYAAPVYAAPVHTAPVHAAPVYAAPVYDAPAGPARPAKPAAAPRTAGRHRKS